MQRNSQSNGSKNKKEQEGHFAVRQLPPELVAHYKELGTLKEVRKTRFYHTGSESLDVLRPCITVTRFDPDEGDVTDEWEWSYQGPGRQLPKQVFRTYRQLNRLKTIKAVECHMDNGTPTVVVDSGNKIETWVWDKNGASKGGKSWASWVLNDTEHRDGDEKTYDYGWAISPKKGMDDG